MGRTIYGTARWPQGALLKTDRLAKTKGMTLDQNKKKIPETKQELKKL